MSFAALTFALYLAMTASNGSRIILKKVGDCIPYCVKFVKYMMRSKLKGTACSFMISLMFLAKFR